MTDRAMPDIDWSLYSPRQIREALRTAPNVASPWAKDEAQFRWRRFGDGGRRLVGEVGGWWKGAEWGYYYALFGGMNKECASVERGRELVDAELRSGGWLLDDEA